MFPPPCNLLRNYKSKEVQTLSPVSLELVQTNNLFFPILISVAHSLTLFFFPRYNIDRYKHLLFLSASSSVSSSDKKTSTFPQHDFLHFSQISLWSFNQLKIYVLQVVIQFSKYASNIPLTMFSLWFFLILLIAICHS